MALENKYVLNVDLKFEPMLTNPPKFRQGESGVLLFRVFDNGVEYNINSATKAVIRQETKSGVRLSSDCTFEYLDGKRVIRYDYEKIAMVEIGYNKVVLTIYEGDTVVSIMPFYVIIYDSLEDAVGSYIELIQDLMQIIEDLRLDLENTIKLDEKGKPNGVASLDNSGKIPLLQMPKEFDSFVRHITETVYEHKVHGIDITEDGIIKYKHPNGWQNAGFAPDAVGGSGSGNQILRASIEVVNGIATVTYTGAPTVLQQKWAEGSRNLLYFVTGGNVFVNNTFPVSITGAHTLWYMDSNGNTYTLPFTVTQAMLPQPNIDVDVNDGVVTVDIDKTTSIKKWAKGERDVAYFQYNGTVFTGNSFTVTEVGTYTVYYKLNNDTEYVYTFEVTEDMLPIISKPSMEIIGLYFDLGAVETYSPSLEFSDNNYRITKFKSANSNSYQNFTIPYEPNTVHTSYTIGGGIDFSISSNLNKEFIIGLENEIGQRSEITIFADSNYIYCWNDSEGQLLTSRKHITNSSYTFPTSIKGKLITVIGQKEGSAFGYNTSVTTLTIPASINKIHPIFESSVLTSVNVGNPNMEYSSFWSVSPFRNPNNTITFRASNNSTTKDFVQESNNPKFVFQAT